MDGRLDRLSYPQRQTLRGLRWIGGVGKRLAIAEACGLDGTQVAAALTTLRAECLVEQIETARWALTGDGSALLANDASAMQDGVTPDRKPPLAPAPPVPPVPPVPPAPVQGSRDAIAAELERLANPLRPAFDPKDAAFLCGALRGHFYDLPSVAELLGQMENYWSACFDWMGARRQG